MCPTRCEPTNRQLLTWSFSFLRPVKKLVLLACLYLAMWTAGEITAVRVTALGIDRIKTVNLTPAAGDQGAWGWITSDQPNPMALRRIILALAAVASTMGVLTYLREVTNIKVSMNMVFYIREAVYDKLQRAGFAFHDALPTGELINRSLSDLQNVRMFVNSAVLIAVEIVLIVGGYITLLLWRSPWVAGLALLPLPIWTWYILRFSRQAQPTLKKVMESGDQNVSLITENIAGVHVIKAFATEGQEIDKYGANCDQFFTRVMHRIRLFANFTPVIRGIATASHLAMFLAAGVLIIRGQLSAGDVLMLGAAMGAILGRLQQIAVINDQYQSAIVSARRLHEILMAPASISESPGARPLPPGPGAVRFENLTFGYDPDKPVLENVSFEVPGGSVVAIVGPTGAGKSTLASLLARFYDPQQGRILIDGTDIRDAKLASLRTEIAYVFQETYLFSDTVEANIAYAHPTAGEGHIEAAARLAQAHEFIEQLPEGYDTVLGDRGTTISGGQRQRLAIARAIVAEPRILILDDATAAIDAETEDDIRTALRLVMARCTTFVIAHRISTVRNANVVIVLEDGRITQMGTHTDLLVQPGHYRQIVNLQLYGGEVDDDGEAGPSHLQRMRQFYRQRGRATQMEGAASGPED